MAFMEMTKIIKPSEKGIAKLDHVVVDKRESMFSAFAGEGQFCPLGTYARLIVNGQTMMSDTRMERITNFAVLDNAHGNVLIAGLGIGMVLTGILKKPEVATVTVVEKYPDVVDLVEPQIRAALPEHAHKLTVLHGDIFVWRPAKGAKYHTIYFDIWADICTDTLPEMGRLHQAFKSYLCRDGKRKPWMNSWQRDKLRNDKRRGW